MAEIQTVDREKFCVINVKYKEISWRVSKKKKKRKVLEKSQTNKVTSRSYELNSCLKKATKGVGVKNIKMKVASLVDGHGPLHYITLYLSL